MDNSIQVTSGTPLITLRNVDELQPTRTYWYRVQSQDSIQRSIIPQTPWHRNFAINLIRNKTESKAFEKSKYAI